MRSDHLGHQFSYGTQSNRYIWTLWKLYYGKGQKEQFKKAVEWSKILGEWLFFNISSHLKPTFKGKKHWLLVDFAWSYFSKEKSELKKMMFGFINDLKTKSGIHVQCARCQNSRKNEDFEKFSTRKWPYWTKLCYLFSRVDAMLNGGKFSPFLRHGLLAETASTATLLENNRLTLMRDLSPFQQFFGKGKRSILTLVQNFGEMCSTTHCNNSYPAKLSNCGTLEIWVDFTEVI